MGSDLRECPSTQTYCQCREGPTITASCPSQFVPNPKYKLTFLQVNAVTEFFFLLSLQFPTSSPQPDQTKSS